MHRRQPGSRSPRLVSAADVLAEAFGHPPLQKGAACTSVGDIGYPDKVSLPSTAFHLHEKAVRWIVQACQRASWRRCRSSCAGAHRSCAATIPGKGGARVMPRLRNARRRMRRNDRCWRRDRRACKAGCGGVLADALISAGIGVGARLAPDCCNRGKPMAILCANFVIPVSACATALFIVHAHRPDFPRTWRREELSLRRGSRA